MYRWYSVVVSIVGCDPTPGLKSRYRHILTASSLEFNPLPLCDSQGEKKKVKKKNEILIFLVLVFGFLDKTNMLRSN